MKAKSEYYWTIEAYEHHVNLWLKWETNAPFRAQQLYSGTDGEYVYVV